MKYPIKFKTQQALIALSLTACAGSAYSQEVTQFSTIEVTGQAESAATQAGVEVAPSTSTLETGGSEVQLNIIELKGVAGTQGDPLGAVKTLPGVVSVTTGGSGGRPSGFFVRGSSANENRIWVDEMPVGYIFHFGGLYSVLNPDLIDNFKTYLGGFGVQYGDRLGGVVDVTTRKPNANKLSQSYQLGFYDSSARIEGPTSQNGSAFFAVRRSYIDLFLPATGKLGSSGNTYTQFPEFWDMQAKYRHELKKGFVDVSLFTANDALRFDIKGEEQAAQDPALLGDLGSKQGFQTFGARWYQTLNKNIEQKIRLGVQRTSNKFVIGTQQANDLNPGDSFGFNQQGITQFLLPRWEITQDESLWKVGVDLFQYQFKLDGYIGAPCREGQPDCNLTEWSASNINQNFTGSETSAYVELDRPITDRLFMKLGVRSSHYDYAAKPYHETLPRLNLEYDLTDNTLLTAAWGQYVQVPEGSEISKSIGNPELVMTRAEHRILGVKHELSALWSTQVEVFQKPMTKLVVSRPSPTNFANEGQGLAQGVDVLLKRKWSQGAYGWLSYSYLQSTRTDKAISDSARLFDGDQPHTLNLVWAQPFGGSWSQWTWGASLQTHSGLPYTKVVGREYIATPYAAGTACDAASPNTNCYWNPIYGETNKSRLPFTSRLDLSMEKNIKYTDWNLDLRFELLNVLSLVLPSTSVVGYKYDPDFANYQNPEAVSGFPFLPSFSIRGNF